VSFSTNEEPSIATSYFSVDRNYNEQEKISWESCGLTFIVYTSRRKCSSRNLHQCQNQKYHSAQPETPPTFHGYFLTLTSFTVQNSNNSFLIKTSFSTNPKSHILLKWTCSVIQIKEKENTFCFKNQKHKIIKQKPSISSNKMVPFSNSHFELTPRWNQNHFLTYMTPSSEKNFLEKQAKIIVKPEILRS